MLQTADAGPLGIVRFDLLREVPHGVSMRHGGVSPAPFHSANMGYSTLDAEGNVAENRRRFLTLLGMPAGSVVAGRLTHGNAVAVFRRDREDEWPRDREPVRPGSNREDSVFRADAVVSNVPNLHFLLTVADCVPILFLDRRSGAVGAAHAGWRGTAAGIAAEVVRAMGRAFGTRPEDIVAGIGPSIGPCCYSVGREVTDMFRRHGLTPHTVDRGGMTYLDLWSSNIRQLADMGVPQGSVEFSGVCTSCGVSGFFSHRAERGTTGRMAFAIGVG